jgi:hypothetical protein
MSLAIILKILVKFLKLTYATSMDLYALLIIFIFNKLIISFLNDT